ncbi:MAG0490 family ComEA-like DNA-binding protein [Mycoplasmopsis fermentans]|uniref:MAG0490 family ComEA-like DNA-binding protein n=1 Tax=Mycoplasmopsis fermentans TaxID=2115 RepID=UPI0001E32FB9|nr:hypothetical protein [Mycoplasmopsis fermentans]ADN69285.1 conserved hypothetical membrane spanning protein [Mycoplasmopsis fermentans JER]
MKYRKIILGTLLAGTIVISTSTIAFNIQRTKVAKVKSNDPASIGSKFCIKVSGAVAFAKNYYFEKPIYLKELLDMAQPYENADLSKINLKKELKENLNIYIPYKKTDKHFLYWNNLSKKHFKLLVDLGIKKSIVNKILALREKKNQITWNDLENISGVGKVTLKKLQEILIL